MTSDLLTPAEASEYSRISVDALAQLRYRGKGPKYLKPTAGTVLYRLGDIKEWLDASERTSTAQVA